MIYWELFYVFFTVGLFTFGGGHAMIPLMQQEIVAHGWIDAQTVIDFIAVSESTPGPFAVNMATFVGYRMGGAFGCFCSVLGIVLPSFLIILLIAKFFKNFGDNKYVKGVFSFLRPAVCGLIAYAASSITVTAIAEYSGEVAYINIYAVGLIALLFWISSKFKKLHPIALIVLSAILGILLYGVIL